MKNLTNIALLAMATFGIASCTQTEVYDPNFKYKEYEDTFEKTFGEIPANQSWDFYAQALKAAGTRAGSMVGVDNTISQPTDIDFTRWHTMLQNGVDNRHIGTHDYSLVSPSNGKFKLYAVWYAGWYETYKKYNFEFGMVVNGERHKIFDGRNVDTEPVYDSTGAAFSGNPGLAADVYVPAGSPFYFYVKYTNNGSDVYVYSNEGNSSLLYSEDIASDRQVMVVGFEDTKSNTWGSSKPDFNDVVLYIEGNPELPIPVAKRFMCEDMGEIGDFDFNDVVFDIQPGATADKAIVTLQAAGGTLPAVLTINGQLIGEVHSLLGVGTGTMVNTGAGPTVPVYTTTIDVDSSFDLSTFTDVKLNVTYDDGSVREITYSADGQAPCVLITPISTKWMSERINIKTGYPTFFSDGWTNTFNKQYLYK